MVTSPRAEPVPLLLRQTPAVPHDLRLDVRFFNSRNLGFGSGNSRGLDTSARLTVSLVNLIDNRRSCHDKELTLQTFLITSMEKSKESQRKPNPSA